MRKLANYIDTHAWTHWLLALAWASILGLCVR